MTASYSVGDAIAALDSVFPLATQDAWDNSGLLVGDPAAPLRGVLLCVDITSAAVGEAMSRGCNLVVSHHPIMFRGLKRLTGSTPEQRLVAEAVKGGVALAAFHTPADKTLCGTSGAVGRLLGLRSLRILVPEADALSKVVVFVPAADAEAVAEAMAAAGAGHIGNYSHCAWSVAGEGRFRAEEGANPYVGSVGQVHREAERRVEVICPKRLLGGVVSAAIGAHPYEEPAIDIVPLSNRLGSLGYGVVGDLPEALGFGEFMAVLKAKLGCASVRVAGAAGRVARVAICTGSGSEFVSAAAGAGADVYVTADVKYHQMADAADKIAVADVGHYESEAVTVQIFRDILTKKLANFARCEVCSETNPIKYY